MLFARITLLVTVCSQNHLPCQGDITPSSPPTKMKEKADSPPHPSNTDDNNAGDDNANNNAADDNATDNAAAIQTMVDDTDNDAVMKLAGGNADDGNAAADDDADDSAAMQTRAQRHQQQCRQQHSCQ
jgi:hypothetical protein